MVRITVKKKTEASLAESPIFPGNLDCTGNLHGTIDYGDSALNSRGSRAVCQHLSPDGIKCTVTVIP
jgi:hypothetical protein